MELEQIHQKTEPGYGSFSTLTDRPVLTITVEDGPARCETARFDQGRVEFGRGETCDFQLNDPLVEKTQGVFFRSDEGFLLQEMGPSKGIKVSLGEADLEQASVLGLEPLNIFGEARLRLGNSVLHIHVDQVFHSQQETGAFRIKLSKKDAGQFMATQKPSLAQAGVKDTDPRLKILMDLTIKLNRLSHLGEILDLIAEAAFHAFSSGNLFSINRLDRDEIHPIQVRVRDLKTGETPEVVLSRSVLTRVVETEEAVLFVQGEQNAKPTHSMLMAGISSCMCAPLVGQRGLLGIVQLDTRQNGQRFSKTDLSLFCVLASHAAFALERANMADDIYRMFERFVEASVSAIEARDPSTAGHSERVAKYSLSLAEAVNHHQMGPYGSLTFGPGQLTELRYAALLHDFGKVGVRESVLMKGNRLNDKQMEIIHHRLKRIGAAYRANLTHALLTRYVKLGQTIPQDALTEIQTRVSQFSAILGDEEQFLHQTRGKWTLETSDISRICAFGRRSIETMEGEVLRFLTDQELENLTIPVGTLTAKEWEDMRTHVSQSEAYLRRIPWSEDLQQVPCIAGAHHERLDGSGYPRGLTAQEISPRVRILIIADIFDAITAWDRPYTVSFNVEDARGILQNKVEQGAIDGALVALFLETVLPKVIHLVPEH